MNLRLRNAILTGCLLVIALHLEQGGRLLREVWRGPYLAPRAAVVDAAHAKLDARRAKSEATAAIEAAWAPSTQLASSK